MSSQDEISAADVAGVTEVLAPKGKRSYETSVVKTDGTWTALCACGTLPTDSGNAPWYSSGWDTEELAQIRLDEHIAEHRTGHPMRELADFRAQHGGNGKAPGHVRLPGGGS